MEVDNVRAGWVKLFRSFTDWQWWSDQNTSRLFIWLLANVNHETKKWQGHEIRAGQIITGRKSLAVKVGFSEQQIRTCLEKLKSTGEITIESLGFSSLISVVNWEKYQVSTSETTKSQPSTNQVSTTTKELKKEKNIYSPFDLESVYAMYPKKEGKKKGLENLAKQVKTSEQFENLKLAAKNYADKVLNEGTDVKYQKHFSTFANCWADYVSPEKSMSVQDLAKRAELELEVMLNKMDEEAIAKLEAQND